MLAAQIVPFFNAAKIAFGFFCFGLISVIITLNLTFAQNFHR